ncbi:hypothetical protein DMENIID0001_114630 [Sergentomyia squamirostris]
MDQKSRFHRTQSKVWWTSEPPSIYDVLTCQPRSNLSPNSSSEERHGSPQSHKSQDSGFSDADTSNSGRNCLESPGNSPRSKLTPKKDVNSQINEHINLSRTPSSAESEKHTPPTVIRRPGVTHRLPPTRRISFSASEDEGDTSVRVKKNCTLVRGRIVQKAPNRNLIGYLSPLIKSPGDEVARTSPCVSSPKSTSTPNTSPTTDTLPPYFPRDATACHRNSYHGRYTLSVEHWVENLRTEYCHEVLTTLQSKSIAAEVTKSNMKLNATLAARLIRHLQAKAIDLETAFIEVETMLSGAKDSDSLPQSMRKLADGVGDFMNYLERKMTLNVRELADSIVNNRDMVADLETALPNIEDYELESLQEDIQLLKRCVLITVRKVLEALLKVIVVSIEDSRNDLILRANLWTISMLSNFDYRGFSSLSPAFESCDTVRVLLLIVVESQHSSVRALALRALASVCSTEVTIRQLEQTGGVEILGEVIGQRGIKRTEPEIREAVSVLAQITAPWHGEEHKVRDLSDCLESLVENITDLACWTKCCQTLLLCTACLNNLSRLEVTSIYSLMAHESIGRVKKAIESRGPAVFIFLHEQITSIMHNMAANKKCHYHLSNPSIINFIGRIFHARFYAKYSSRAETQSQRRTVKNILHILSRLIHESSLGVEILRKNIVPIFSGVDNSSEFERDISFLNRKLNESLGNRSFSDSDDDQKSPTTTTVYHCRKNESYV